METTEALILGVIQGLTEYLPVSSSGHLVAGSQVLGASSSGAENLLFTVMVHAATALSSIIVFRKEIGELIKGIFSFKWNDSTRYLLFLILGAIPVGIVGLMWKDELSALMDSPSILTIVGVCWLFTALLLLFTAFKQSGDRKVGWVDSIVIGIAQAVAVLPGVSRSGSTIATGLLLGIDRERAARFSFLMVIAPILGEALLDVKKIAEGEATTAGMGTTPLIVGFIAAFVTGLAACYLMLGLVKHGKLPWFSAYLFIVGVLAILFGTGVL